MTYEDIKELTSNFGKQFPLSAKNEDGEFVIIEEGKSDDNIHYYRTTTAQNNDWCRINYFYADGTTEELWEK